MRAEGLDPQLNGKSQASPAKTFVNKSYISALSGGRYPSPYISLAEETIINAFLSSSRTMSRRRGYIVGFTTHSNTFLSSPVYAPLASM